MRKFNSYLLNNKNNKCRLNWKAINNTASNEKKNYKRFNCIELMVLKMTSNNSNNSEPARAKEEHLLLAPRIST